MKRYQTAGRAQLTAYLAAHAAARPQSAKEICAGLAAATQAPGNSSVYRLIAVLCEEGSLRRTKDAEGSAVYQYVGEGGRACLAHFHLQCTVCGRVTHLTCGCGAEIAGMLAAEHGFAVDSGKTVFYGVCAACGEKKPAEGKGIELPFNGTDTKTGCHACGAQPKKGKRA